LWKGIYRKRLAITIRRGLVAVWTHPGRNMKNPRAYHSVRPYSGRKDCNRFVTLAGFACMDLLFEPNHGDRL